MGERLRYAIDVPPEPRGFALPPMLLQPWSRTPSATGSSRRSRAARSRSRAARGRGVVRRDRRQRRGLRAHHARRRGLSNLRERLQLLYGERASLESPRTRRRGTRVRVKLPA
jgi:sensor histidine kinase YesM